MTKEPKTMTDLTDYCLPEWTARWDGAEQVLVTDPDGYEFCLEAATTAAEAERLIYDADWALLECEWRDRSYADAVADNAAIIVGGDL